MLLRPPALPVTLAALLALACGDDGPSMGPSSTGSTSTAGNDSTAETAGSTADTTADGTEGSSGPSDCEGIVDASGAVVPDAYLAMAHDWSRDAIDCRLGPRFSGDGSDDRPTAYEPPHMQSASYLCPTYELSGECDGSCDYGSTSGQVLYVPDDASDPGIDRVQTYAYNDGLICESPQAGGWLGGPHPDPAVEAFAAAVGRPVQPPIAFGMTDMVQTNGGILVFHDGLVGATGNQTSGTTYPTFQFPENLVPTAVAVSGYNELAVVTLWDTDALGGKLAVFALRSVKPEAFTIPLFALPNEAGFVALHHLGTIDLPDMVAPTAVGISEDNGGTPGGHAIGNEFGDLEDPDLRAAFARDDSERWVASHGLAVVVSKYEDAVTFVDFTPLFAFVRAQYFGSQESFDTAKQTEGGWAYTFESNPEMTPVVVATVSVPRPTVARAGNQLGAFPNGLQSTIHAFVANEAGEVRLFDVSAFMTDERPIDSATIVEEASVQGPKNITSMTLVKDGSFNRNAIVSGREDRTIAWLEVGENDFTVTRTLTDTRIGDPVWVDKNDRGPLVTIGDFDGRAILSFRTGPTEDNGRKPPANYGCGEGGADATCEDFEFAGEVSYPGTPFAVLTSNVN